MPTKQSTLQRNELGAQGAHTTHQPCTGMIKIYKMTPSSSSIHPIGSGHGEPMGLSHSEG